MSIFALALHPAYAIAKDTLYVTNSDAEIVSVIDGERGVITSEIKAGKGPCDIVIDPKGEIIAISHEEKRGEVWFLNRKDLSLKGKTLLVQETEGRRTNCFFLAFSKDSKKLYAANRYSGMLFVVDAQKASITKHISLSRNKPFRLEGAALSPDGTLLYLPNGVGKEILVVDAVKDEPVEPIPLGHDASAIAFSPDGLRLYAADGDAPSLDVISVETKAVIKRIPIGNQPAGIAVSKDGAFVFVSNKMSFDVDKIDAVLLKKTANIPVGMYPIGLAVSDDGKKVYVCNYNEDSVSIIDAASAKEIIRVATGSTPLKIAVYGEP
ncbi:MAG: beta-propeller fold lactonase family protein [Deltaproteobacteria bacterium]|nr:beta-propeller fold lactonase family protein [Deltaproteobacteria bacterium]